ncbi:hypothetical protein C1646_670326 [Rhizophagus diaphanus]|nr:hypothetical protein C1646_670326 [Rhizophagus diaphanus] [Rhizophagus sp. MUCL 43196]
MGCELGSSGPKSVFTYTRLFLLQWGSLSPSGGSTRRMDYLIRQKGCWDTNAQASKMVENHWGFITRYKKITGKKKSNITDKTRGDFQTAKTNDRMNQKSDVYADWYSEVDKESSSKNRHQNDELDSSFENTPTTRLDPSFEYIPSRYSPANEDADKSKLYEELANDVVKQYITSERLEDIWRTVMKRLEDKRIRVQSIESRIIDLTNWTNLEWSRILKHEDKIALMKSFNKKLEKERIDQKVLDFIDNPSNSLVIIYNFICYFVKRNLNDLQEWKTKISTIGSEDAILASEIISFL